MEKEIHSRPVRQDKEERLKIGAFQGDGSVFEYEAMARLLADASAFETALPFVYGSPAKWAAAAKAVGMGEMNPLVQKQVQDIKGKRLQMIANEEQDADDAYFLLEKAVSDLKSRHLRALVSLPVSETNIRSRHPEFKNTAMMVAQAVHTAENGNPFRMLLCGGRLRLSFLTGADRENVEAYLTPQRVEQRIRDLYQTLKSDFSITTPRIAVLSTNKDHTSGELTAADTGKIKPVVVSLFESGIPVFGPYAAGTFFNSPEARAFDAVLCMYKEQMNLCFSLYGKSESCYYTASLPVVHIEPVFEGLNPEESFRSLFRALCTAIDIDASRMLYRRLSENPLPCTGSSRRDSREDD